MTCRQSFADPVAMVKAMGDQDVFHHLTQVSVEEYFSMELGWGDRIVRMAVCMQLWEEISRYC